MSRRSTSSTAMSLGCGSGSAMASGFTGPGIAAGRRFNAGGAGRPIRAGDLRETHPYRCPKPAPPNTTTPSSTPMTRPVRCRCRWWPTPASTGGDDARPDIPWFHTVIYETHVRGLMMRHPDIPPELRGTYAGPGPIRRRSRTFTRPGCHRRGTAAGTSVRLPRSTPSTRTSATTGVQTWRWAIAPTTASRLPRYGEQVVEFKENMVRRRTQWVGGVIPTSSHNQPGEGNQLGHAVLARNRQRRLLPAARSAESAALPPTTPAAGTRMNLTQPHADPDDHGLALRYWVTGCMWTVSA